MCYVVLHFSFVVKVGFDCTSVMMQSINVFVCNPTTSFRDFRARDTEGIPIIDVSVPYKLAFNLTYGGSVCCLILHLHNLSVSEAEFGSLVLPKNIHQIV